MTEKIESDSMSISKNPFKRGVLKRGKRKSTFFTIAVFGLFAIFVGKYFRPVVVDGPSMLPTLHNREWLTVSDAYWLFGPIKPKDIVVFRMAGKTGYVIKRVYKMEGEKVDLVNSPKGWSFANSEYVVPKGKIFVLGDNRPQSEDSRVFGAIDLSTVIGKVIVFR